MTKDGYAYCGWNALFPHCITPSCRPSRHYEVARPYYPQSSALVSSFGTGSVAISKERLIRLSDI